MKKTSINHNAENEKENEKLNLKEALIASEIRYRRLFESAKKQYEFSTLKQG